MNTNVMGTTKILEIARMKKLKNLSILLPHLVMEFQKISIKFEIKCEYPYALSKNLESKLLCTGIKSIILIVTQQDYLMFMDLGLEHLGIGQFCVFLHKF